MTAIEIKKLAHKIIDNSGDEIVLAVYTLLNANYAEDMLGCSVAEYNKELEDAEASIDSGKFISQEGLEKEMKKW